MIQIPYVFRELCINILYVIEFKATNIVKGLLILLIIIIMSKPAYLTQIDILPPINPRSILLNTEFRSPQNRLPNNYGGQTTTHKSHIKCITFI